MKLEVDHLTQGYGDKTVIDDISFSVESGEILALLGPNGSGKSTLIKTMCNIMDPKFGDIVLDGASIKDYDTTDFAKLVSYVPQSMMSGVYTTVMDTVLQGRRPYVSWSYREKDLEYAVEAMRSMRVEQYSHINVSDLSGGQKQRVFIARSLAQCPSFFIFDEPTSALDLRHQMNTMTVMRDIVHEKKSCMVIALHDINLALNYTDRVIVLKNGKILRDGPPESVITEDTIREAYGVESRIIDVPEGRYILPFSASLEGDD